MKSIQNSISNYFSRLGKALESVTTTQLDLNELNREQGIEEAMNMILQCKKDDGRLYFIGNGASASISSHQAADFTKAGDIPAMCFNDAALLTCLGNDLGYENVFAKPVQMYAREQDIVIAISSSGESQNILKAVDAAKLKEAKVITLSGFSLDNSLRQKGDLNFYVNAQSYGHVEISHHAICHCILDSIIALNEQMFNKASERRHLKV